MTVCGECGKRLKDWELLNRHQKVEQICDQIYIDGIHDMTPRDSARLARMI